MCVCVHVCVYVWYSRVGDTRHGRLWGFAPSSSRSSGPVLQAAVPHLEAVAGLLSDRSWEVRQAACSALGNHGKAFGRGNCYNECSYIKLGCAPVCGNAVPNARVPQYMGMQSHILGYPSRRECMPIYWGTPVEGNACPYTGVPQYMGMLSQLLGYPSIWECFPNY